MPAFGARFIAEPIFVLTDSALIGQLGKAELAGMSIAATLVTTVVALMNFLAYSVTPAVAQPSARRTCAAPGRLVWTALMGRLRPRHAPHDRRIRLRRPCCCAASARPDETMSYALDYLHHSLWGIPPMMIILAQVGTLRGLQDTVTPLKVATVGTLVNIVLNWLLIYPVGWALRFGDRHLHHPVGHGCRARCGPDARQLRTRVR